MIGVGFQIKRLCCPFVAVVWPCDLQFCYQYLLLPDEMFYHPLMIGYHRRAHALATS